MRLSTAEDVFKANHPPVAAARLPQPAINATTASGKSE
jgi:hypothetical protein